MKIKDGLGNLSLNFKSQVHVLLPLLLLFPLNVTQINDGWDLTLLDIKRNWGDLLNYICKLI
jgi:hypothetical protein